MLQKREKTQRGYRCMRWPRGQRQPLCARTGLVCWLLILIRAGVLEPGSPSRGAAAGFAFACKTSAQLATASNSWTLQSTNFCTPQPGGD